MRKICTLLITVLAAVATAQLNGQTTAGSTNNNTGTGFGTTGTGIGVTGTTGAGTTTAGGGTGGTTGSGGTIGTGSGTQGLDNLFGRANFDQRFVTQASIGNLQEIRLGQLAQTNSQNTNVQNFGAMLVADHSAAQAQLQTIATNLGLTVPSTNSFSQLLFNRMSALTGTQFDQLFIGFNIGAHIQDIQRYESAALRGQNLAVRDYARTNLPVLMDHLVTALTIRESLPQIQPATTGTGTLGTGTTTGTTTRPTTGTGATGGGTTGPGTTGSGTTGTGNTGTGPGAGASVSGGVGGTSGTASGSGTTTTSGM